ncbi:hypothetical protein METBISCDRAFT_22562 [Metschnikowia bicuspidata]|uniref:Uncharacterized protein n=1 Tax=Metschnikowia bicuspidata TaxID=27322 RepID=A0A4P9ZE44_9ASCO|nr:hypothetical protein METBISCDRAFT_22562 [Metschnikowia bicuspidata]
MPMRADTSDLRNTLPPKGHQNTALNSVRPDLTPLSVSSISEEDLTVFCEYLSLLHLNAFPNYSNPHVSNTTSPLLFNILQNNTKALSVQATTNSSSYLSYHRGKDYYSMEFMRPTR